MTHFLLALLCFIGGIFLGQILGILGYDDSSFRPLSLGPIASSAGVLAALYALFKSRERNASDDYMKNAIGLLQKAFEALAVDTKTQVPTNSRMSWLTSARLIRTAETTAARITEESHRKIWQAERTYWRVRFYDAVRPNGNDLPATFFAEHPEHMVAHTSKDRAPIDPISIAVIYRFTQWPEGEVDPLDGDEPFCEEELQRMRIRGPRDLANLLLTVKGYRDGSIPMPD